MAPLQERNYIIIVIKAGMLVHFDEDLLNQEPVDAENGKGIGEVQITTETLIIITALGMLKCWL